MNCYYCCIGVDFWIVINSNYGNRICCIDCLRSGDIKI